VERQEVAEDGDPQHREGGGEAPSGEEQSQDARGAGSPAQWRRSSHGVAWSG